MHFKHQNNDKYIISAQQKLIQWIIEGNMKIKWDKLRKIPTTVSVI